MTPPVELIDGNRLKFILRSLTIFAGEVFYFSKTILTRKTEEIKANK